MISIVEFFEELSEFWSRKYKSIAAGRLKPILQKVVLFEIQGGDSAIICFREGALEIAPARSARYDARICMSREDWLDVMAGRVGIMSVVVAGRCPYPKDQRLTISKAGIVLQSIVTMMDKG